MSDTHDCDGWDSCPNPAHRPASTLTRFLLARIAEDEAAAQILADGYPDHPGASYMAANLDLIEVTTGYSRVLAECEAKRDIIRRARRERGRYDEFGDSVGNPIQAVVAWEMAVRLLASVYTDHPDYREEWRA